MWSSPLGAKCRHLRASADGLSHRDRYGRHGVSFAGDAVQMEPLRAEAEFVGVRVRLLARCGTARLPLQIDMGFGDDVWPEAHACTYPALLEFPPPSPWAYPPEAEAGTWPPGGPWLSPKEPLAGNK